MSLLFAKEPIKERLHTRGRQTDQYRCSQEVGRSSVMSYPQIGIDSSGVPGFYKGRR